VCAAATPQSVHSACWRVQGATCYLNSLLQTLFHVPEFRRAVYHMPTEEGEEPTSSICVALKYLFFRLQYSPTPVSTKELIEAFGWHSAEAFQQHDVQELELILYDKLEAKMKGARPAAHPLWSRRLCSGWMHGSHAAGGGISWLQVQVPPHRLLSWRSLGLFPTCSAFAQTAAARADTIVDKTIANLLKGKHQYTTRCINIEYESTRKEEFVDIQMPVQGCRDIYSSFEKLCEVRATRLAALLTKARMHSSGEAACH
jgi:Ubiquitin carboxyl-terminal hydrolase